MQKLWSPSQEQIKSSQMYQFMQQVNDRHGVDLQDYRSLHQWSVDHLAEFWKMLSEFVGVNFTEKAQETVVFHEHMRDTEWFQGASLNFAQHLLRYRDDKIALVFQGEGQQPRRMTYQELYQEVAQVAAALRKSGVQSGDRVVGFMPNMIETVVAMLAATSLGALWSSCSPDFGIQGVLDRFGQIEPKVLFTANGYRYKGKTHDSLEQISGILAKLPSVEKVVVVPYTEDKADISSLPKACHYQDFLVSSEKIDFSPLPFSHPLYIMYSSGTTGLPKCLVQSAGGILLNHLKELVLHNDLTREDTIFYFTTCGWMMWNWLVSSLATGATVVLYDGSPFSPSPESLWEMVDRENITIFGTSAKYLASLEKQGIKPKETHSLASLRAILSTGSPLMTENFHYVYRDIKEDLQLASISGGTDLNGCFVAGNPFSPVYEGEIQDKCLAMDVAAFDENGNPVVDQKGELVCRKPFPSMPLYFWNDPNHERYDKAYFKAFPGVWHHGDFIKINSQTGGIVIYGRSDATLNPGGVRIGTAEIYRQVETIDEIADSLVVGQQWKGDTRVILFVKMAEGAELTDELREQIRDTIGENATIRHVPAKIIAVGDIPYTINMKKVELAVRKIIHGQPVKNRDALKNPESLEHYQDLPELQQD